MNWIKEVIGWFVKTSIDDKTVNYRSSYLRNQELLSQFSLEMDKALMMFSIAALAALAALNNSIFKPLPIFSIIVLSLFIGVVISVILGFFFTKGLLVDANKIITKNYKKSRDLNKGLELVRYNKTTKIINWISLMLFVVAMISFIVLMIFYIGGLK